MTALTERMAASCMDVPDDGAIGVQVGVRHNQVQN